MQFGCPKPSTYGRFGLPQRVIVEVVLAKELVSERKGRCSRNYAKRKGLSGFFLFAGCVSYGKTAFRTVFGAEKCGTEAGCVF